ncbi:MAG: hypothetical protein KA821_05275 [Chitinophagaceae bacterium]|nr:hypothetical protein [Chitinophagaceae bacterium]
MIKQLLICLLLTGPLAGAAQSAGGADSLWVVKNYLMSIQQTINNTKFTEKQRIVQLDSLTRLSTGYKQLFAAELKKVVPDDRERENMNRSLNYILQSMVLYKSDIKKNNYKRSKSSNTELSYLNTNIPLLLSLIQKTLLPAAK